MNTSATLMFGAVLMLSTGNAALAAQTSSHNISATNSNTVQGAVNEEVGTISSITSSEMVLSHSVKGKQEKTTFRLNSGTKTEGEIGTGADVAVYYRDQNHERVATEIKAEPKKS